MRILKMTAFSLLCLAVALPLCERLSPGFLVSGQGGSLSAPTNVIASDNAYSTKVGITWDAVRGATSYKIFRNTTNDPATAASLGTTAEPSFFDANAVAGQTSFYWVRAENGSILSPFSQADQGTRANGVTVFGPV